MAGTKEGAAKRRQTIIDTRFNGDEAAYRAWQRSNASKGGRIGGAKSPTNFKNLKRKQHQAISAKGGKATIKANKDMPDNKHKLGIEKEQHNA